MPSKALSRELKTAIEGREWVMNTTKNDILYEETIRHLENLYKMHDIAFTHNQWDGSSDPEEGCNECIVTIIGGVMLCTLIHLLLNQMLPLLEPYDG
jgi:hypothetical protein